MLLRGKPEMDSRTGERGAAFKMASLLKFALNQEGLDLKTFSIFLFQKGARELENFQYI